MHDPEVPDSGASHEPADAGGSEQALVDEEPAGAGGTDADRATDEPGAVEPIDATEPTGDPPDAVEPTDATEPSDATKPGGEPPVAEARETVDPPDVVATDVVQPADTGEQTEAVQVVPVEPVTPEATDAGSAPARDWPPVEARPIEPAAAPLTQPAAVRELRPGRPLPRTIAVANQKGGVGKTTTAVNLGASLAELGFRVLVVDLDPQGNATTGLGINPRNLGASIYDVLMNEVPMEDCVEPTALRNLFLAPATIDLAGAEIELVPAFSRELRLRRALERQGDAYDFVLVDCPPSLGLLTINGLAAVSEVLVPIQCEYYALEGVGQLIRNIHLVQSNLNPRLELTTIVLTMYDARTKLSDQVVKEVRAHFGAKVCRNIVPRTVRLSEAPSFGQPILVFDSTSRGALAYRELAKEVSGGAARRTG